ncbi:hypothetical protein G5V59_27120 [Nocardioides sp. W3-2-3]|nr:hypothetical protein [Nocardioides convexus]
MGASAAPLPDVAARGHLLPRDGPAVRLPPRRPGRRLPNAGVGHDRAPRGDPGRAPGVGAQHEEERARRLVVLLLVGLPDRRRTGEPGARAAQDERPDHPAAARTRAGRAGRARRR